MMGAMLLYDELWAKAKIKGQYYYYYKYYDNYHDLLKAVFGNTLDIMLNGLYFTLILVIMQLIMQPF
jgi:hypothetical protein